MYSHLFVELGEREVDLMGTFSKERNKSADEHKA